nr:MATE family efflux transporter [Clostridia bacterium]
MKAKIQLSDHFSYRKLFKFTLPSIVMMIFSSVYGVVDGFFVSNFVGKGAFTAINFIMPYLMVLGSVGFMFGTGGSALVSKTLGEGNKEKAVRLFSLLVYASIIIGGLLTILGLFTLRPVASLLGAEGQLLEESVLYGKYISFGLIAYMLQMEFQSFFITAEKPQLGLIFTVASGVTNMLLDALFVAVFKWGIVGAAVATLASQIVGGFGPLLYFFRKNSSLLRLTKTSFDGKALLKTCGNGSSELMSNISMSLVCMLYNAQLMRYIGEDGVAAYGALMYVCMIFLAVFIGYGVGIAPVVGYHFGANNRAELKNLLKKSLTIISILSVSMFVFGELMAVPLSKLFVGYDEGLLALTKRAFVLYSFSYLPVGLAIFGSCFFTALNNGLISAIMSFLRTLVFQAAAVILLPLVFPSPVDGIWISIVVAEFLAAVLTVVFLLANKKKYGYM